MAAAQIDGFYVQGCDTFVFADLVTLNLGLLANKLRFYYLLSFRYSKVNSKGFFRVEVYLFKADFRWFALVIRLLTFN